MPLYTHAQVVISEFLFDAEGPDQGREWVEIYNAGDQPIDISKYRLLTNSAHSLAVPPKNGGIGSLVLPPKAYAVLADDAAGFHTTYPVVAVVIDTSISLTNKKGEVKLLSGTQVIDDVSYTNDNKNAAGLSLQKIDGLWKLGVPTPGALNHVDQVVPDAPPQAAHVSAPKKTAPIATSRASSKTKTKTKRSKKMAAVSDPVSDPVHDVVSDPVSDATSSEVIVSDSSQVAAAAAPSSAWLWAVAGLSGVSIAGLLAYRRVKRDEWDIIDDSDTSE